MMGVPISYFILVCLFLKNISKIVDISFFHFGIVHILSTTIVSIVKIYGHFVTYFLKKKKMDINFRVFQNSAILQRQPFVYSDEKTINVIDFKFAIQDIN